jgi:hypothetical protein
MPTRMFHEIVRSLPIVHIKTRLISWHMGLMLRAVDVLVTLPGIITLGRLVIPTDMHILSAGC